MSLRSITRSPRRKKPSAVFHAALGVLLSVAGALVAPTAGKADAGRLNLRVEAASGLPVMGHLAPRGTDDQHSEWGFNFWLSGDYVLIGPFAIDVLLGAGKLIETDDHMRVPGAPGYVSNDGNTIAQAAIGPKLRFGQLWLAGHVGIYAFDGAQFGADLGLGYDFEITDAIDVGLLMRGQVTAEGDGAGQFVVGGDDRTDAALWFGIGAQYAVLGPVEPATDTDGDGIFDDADECVHQPEDRDSHDDDDGCPDSDNDGDGIPDDRDGAPDQAEDADGFEDDDGVPDTDNDGDGIDDASDAAPNEPEDVDGHEDEDGAPDVDNDGDGIFDAQDRCPMEPGVAAESGCPELDRDGDGVPDRWDNCPDEAGTPEFNGCREQQRVQITDGQLVITETVYFRSNRHRIDRRSFELLDNVARVILAHPEVGTVRIEGHTDDRGRRASNVTLSQRRADEVRRYLVAKGVPAERLTAIGYGPDRPIVQGATSPEDLARNRRVEFRFGEEAAPAPAAP